MTKGRCDRRHGCARRPLPSRLVCVGGRDIRTPPPRPGPPVPLPSACPVGQAAGGGGLPPAADAALSACGAVRTHTSLPWQQPPGPSGSLHRSKPSSDLCPACPSLDVLLGLCCQALTLPSSEFLDMCSHSLSFLFAKWTHLFLVHTRPTATNTHRAQHTHTQHSVSNFHPWLLARSPHGPLAK